MTKYGDVYGPPHLYGTGQDVIEVPPPDPAGPPPPPPPDTPPDVPPPIPEAGPAPVIDYTIPAGMFSLFSPDYGVVQVHWQDPPGPWTELRLMRNTYGPCLDEIDGTVLLARGPGGMMDHRESGLVTGRWAYYSIFVRGTDLIWHRSGDQTILLAVDHGYSAKLYGLLPEVFRTGQTSVLTDPGVENTSLQRFLTVFGRQFDFIRTSYDGLNGVLDVDRVPAVVLPALAHQVGLENEPELGATTMRRLIRNATRLYKLKGSETCLRELATLVTGWSAGVRLGVNQLLDDLDGSFVGSHGRWGASADGVTVGYRTDAGLAPYGKGGVMTLAVAPGPFAVSFTDSTRSRFTGVPVVGSVPYAASAYLRAASPGQSIALRIDWYDAHNSLLATATGIAVTPSVADWGTVATVSSSGPADAAFAGLTLTGTAAGAETFYVGGVQFEKNFFATEFEPARQVQIQLDAEAVNNVINPTGQYGTTDWLGNALSVTSLDGTGAFALTAVGGETSMQGATLGTVPVKPGEDWVLSVDVRSAVVRVPARTAYLGIYRYAGAYADPAEHVDLGSSSSAELAPGWTRLSTVYRVPYDGSVTQISVAVTVAASVADPFDVGELFYFRQVLLLDSPNAGTEYFDGSTPSPTADYMWEGLPHASRSHYYHRRTIKTYRLNALVPRFCPPPTTVAFLFAVKRTTLVAQRTAVVDATAAVLVTPPRPPVGRSLTLVSNTLSGFIAASSLAASFSLTGTLFRAPSGSSGGSTAVTSSLTGTLSTGTAGTAGANVVVRWNTLIN